MYDYRYIYEVRTLGRPLHKYPDIFSREVSEIFIKFL